MAPRPDTPNRFVTSGGRSIYALSIEVFPNFFGNIYILSDGERRLLFDCGSGTESSNNNLIAAMASIGECFDESIELSDIDTVLITHAHVDHFGGLGFVREHTPAPIGVHILDRRVLSHYEERVLVASRQLQVYLQRAGVSAERLERLMRMYTVAKGHYRSQPVELTLEEGQTVFDTQGNDWGLDLFHAPGHCPGQVCIRIDDILLSADHVLARITPHQSPESITLNMGLGHYLDSLTKIDAVEGVRIALGGHEAPIEHLGGRIEEIRRFHDSRLDEALALCGEPKTISDISRELFGRVMGYNVLLAVEETGAHIEYLYQRGELVAANLEEIEDHDVPVICYVRA